MDQAADILYDNILAVVDYLDLRGWKIKKSAAYKHSKEGKLRPREDGRYTQKEVDKYARMFLKRKDSSSQSGVIDTLQEKKLQAETDKMVSAARLWKKKADIADGLYVPREAFEVELAKRASVFKNDIESFIRSQALGIIHLVGGDAAKAPDLIEYMLEQADDWLDRYAEEREFTVPQDTKGGELTGIEDEE